MKLPNEALIRAFVLMSASGALGACSMLPAASGGLADSGYPLSAADAAGPRGDYPMVLGDPFTVDGQEFVPVDSMNYDAVGYAVTDAEAEQGITVAHKTLPLPSYVEITDLNSGRTILARVERRGPMSASQLVALSPAAKALLDMPEGGPVRVRRVNPTEAERAELRAGRKAGDRMDTPASLLTVLQRKLASSPAQAANATGSSPATIASGAPADAETAPQPGGISSTSSVAQSPDQNPRASTRYPLGLTEVVASTPGTSSEAVSVTVPEPTAPAIANGKFLVQAAAFSSRENADRAAKSLGGFVTQAGQFYRVRMGPYASRENAQAALAKVRDAGYSDARVFIAG